jgi:peptide chain release factor 1
MFEAVQGMLAEHAQIEQQLADPALHQDQARSRRLGRRYAELTAIVNTYQDWLRAGDNLEAATELGADDESFAREAD